MLTRAIMTLLHINKATNIYTHDNIYKRMVWIMSLFFVI